MLNRLFIFAVRVGCFHVSKAGLALWTAQLLLQIWSLVRMSFYLIKTINQRIKIECSKDFYCSVFGSLLANMVINPIVVSLVLARLPQSIDVLNMTARLLLRNRYPRHWLTPNMFFIVLLMFVFIVKIIMTIKSTPQKYPELFYPFVLTKFVPLSIILLKSVLCVVAQNSYEDINRELEEIYHVQSNYNRATRLIELMNDHWFLEDYIESMTDTFGPEILLITTNIYIQFLLYSYMIIWQVVVRCEIMLNTMLYISLLFELIVIIGQFIYMCYICDASLNELRLFTLRVNSRKVKVTALGFFDINLSFLFASIGGILTYFLVFVQFQMEGYKRVLETNPPNTSVSEYCYSWPCLEAVYIVKNSTISNLTRV
ncbi:7TM chemoreceptor [Cinara cedri]|uniref:Gustatory receptor n=1 Tax=Cinara cedri TaxID=506608 RepID=A0A5E4MTS4_9HEMI|nr:7TM chemoreceptor [Cinara cedri]